MYYSLPDVALQEAQRSYWHKGCVTDAGVKAWRRARFANTVRLLTDLDEDGLKYVLKNLPAWVKVRSSSLLALSRSPSQSFLVRIPPLKFPHSLHVVH